MGAQSSIDYRTSLSTKDSPPFLQDYVFIGQVADIRFGEIAFWQAKHAAQTLFTKMIDIFPKVGLPPFLAGIHQQTSESARGMFSKLPDHPNVLSMVCAPHQRKDGSLIFGFEKWDTDFLQLLEEMKAKHEHFKEEDFLAYLTSALRGLNHLHSNRVIHGFITPASLLLSKDPSQGNLIKLAPQSLISGPFKLLEILNTAATSCQVIAPEDLTIRIWELHKRDHFKADIFCLGLTCLMGALLEKYATIFKWKSSKQTLVLDQAALTCNLANLKGLYSERVINILAQLLEIDPEKRSDTATILNELETKPLQTPSFSPVQSAGNPKVSPTAAVIPQKKIAFPETRRNMQHIRVTASNIKVVFVNPFHTCPMLKSQNQNNIDLPLQQDFSGAYNSDRKAIPTQMVASPLPAAEPQNSQILEMKQGAILNTRESQHIPTAHPIPDLPFAYNPNTSSGKRGIDSTFGLLKRIAEADGQEEGASRSESKTSPFLASLNAPQEREHSASDVEKGNPVARLSARLRERSSVDANDQERRSVSPQFVVETMAEGGTYEGQVKHGKRHGRGKFYYKGGGYYDGEWKNGVMEGYGRLFYPNSNLAYEGEWKDGKFEGRGCLYNEVIPPKLQSGSIDHRKLPSDDQNFWIKYEGEFLNDSRAGHGSLHFVDGTIYEGGFKADRICGEGVINDQDGNILLHGVWKDDELIQQLE